MSWRPDDGVTQLAFRTGDIYTVQEHAKTLWRATVGLIRGPGAAETIAQLIAFLEVISYQVDSFKVRKRANYQFTAQPLTVPGTGSTVQLYRTFSYDAFTKTRNVVLPYDVTIYDNGSPLNPSASPPDYTVVSDTGMVTFGAHLGDLSLKTVTWDGKEDLWMKLAGPPNYESLTDSPNGPVWRAPGIQLVELRGAPGA